MKVLLKVIMKTTKLYILVGCLVQIFCAGQSYFDNTYKTGYNNLLSACVLTTPDSGCVFVNYIEDSVSGRQDFGLIKLDKHGNEIVKKTSNILNMSYPYFLQGMKHFIAATPCSYFLTGDVPGGSSSTVILNKINRITLDTLKSTFYDDGVYSYYLNSFIKMNNNKYFLIGNKFTITHQWPAIFQLDSNLNIINIKTITNCPTDFGCLNAIYNPGTKKILLEGRLPSGQYPNMFIHVDTLGVISNTYSSVSSFTTGISQTFYSAFDTTYVCIGGKVNFKYGNNNLYSLCIAKYDRNLNMLWQKTYGDYALSNALADAVILPDGSIVASGSYSKLTSLPLINGDQNGVILKVDKDGRFKWMQEYNHYGPGTNTEYYTECFYGIDTTRESGFILCGNVMNLPKAKAWAVKTNGFGCAMPGCISSTVTVDSVIIVHIDPPPVDTSTVGLNKNYLENENILIFPNPVKDKLHFEGSVGLLEDIELGITNTLGQSIYSKTNIDLKEELDLSFLKAGIYYFSIRQTKSESGKKVFKVVKE